MTELFRNDHTHSSAEDAQFWVVLFWVMTRMLGLLKLEKQVLLFFSSTVVTKKILVGAPNMYSVILPVLRSILIPPALFLAKEQIRRSGRQIMSFLRAGWSLRRSSSSSLVAGMATSSSPFSFSFKLSPQPKRFSMTYSCCPLRKPSTKYLTILCLLSSEKMMERVDLSQTMPLGKAKSLRTTDARLVVRSKEMILPFLCLNNTSLLEYLMEISVASVMQMIRFCSSMQRLLSALNAYPPILFTRKVGVFVSISSLTSP